MLYSQPSLDMSLTRMTDTKHDNHQIVHDIFAYSPRKQRRSLVSSKSAQSRKRSIATLDTIGNGVHKGSNMDQVNAAAAATVLHPSNRLAGSSCATHAQDSGDREEACRLKFSAASLGDSNGTAHSTLSQDHARPGQPETSTCAAVWNTSSGSVQSPPYTGYRTSTNLVTETCGSDNVHPAETHSLPVPDADCRSVIKESHHNEVGHGASMGESPISADVASRILNQAAGRHMPLAALPSTIHRKLEAMSARALPTPLSRHNTESSN